MLLPWRTYVHKPKVKSMLPKHDSWTLFSKTKWSVEKKWSKMRHLYISRMKPFLYLERGNGSGCVSHMGVTPLEWDVISTPSQRLGGVMVSVFIELDPLVWVWSVAPALFFPLPSSRQASVSHCEASDVFFYLFIFVTVAPSGVQPNKRWSFEGQLLLVQKANCL